MEQQDLISVIIPVYNVENYVRKTLDSILSQTYKNLEILIVDDGSIDNSGNVCDEYLNDERVKVFHRENVGNAASRQFALEIAKGKYFVSIDADDYVSKDYVEKLYKSIVFNNADISVCGVNLFTDGKSDFHTGFMPSSKYEKLVVTNEILYRDFYKIFNEFLLSDGWNKMYRSNFVRDSGIKFELDKIYNGNELKFNCSILLHCPIFSVCNEAMLFHRVRSNSRVTKKNKPLQEGFEIIIESVLETAKNKGLNLKKQISDIYYWLIGNVVMDIMLRGGDSHEKHLRFKKLIKRNKKFLKKHKNDLKMHSFLQSFKLGDSKIRLPSLFLDSPILLDSASFMITFLRSIKYKDR